MPSGGNQRRARVIVGVSGSPSSIRALRRGAREALSRDAVLVPVHAWLPPRVVLSYPYPVITPSLTAREAGWSKLWSTFDAAFRSTPADADVEPVVVHGPAGPMLLEIADRPDDLLVIGMSHRSALGRWRPARTARYCLARARCPVLVVSAEMADVTVTDGLRARLVRYRPW